MSKRTKPTTTSPKPTADASANDKARAEALAKLTAAPATKSKGALRRGTKATRGSKLDGWENDPLENDAALEAALGKQNVLTATPTVAQDGKRAKGGGTNAKAAKESPRGQRGGRGAKGGMDATATKAKPKRISALAAAAKVLAESDRPLRAIDMVELMHAKGLWTSPGGKTPEATLYAAIIREITAKGKDARFKKVDRGMFAATPTSKTGKEA